MQKDSTKVFIYGYNKGSKLTGCNDMTFVIDSHFDGKWIREFLCEELKLSARMIARLKRKENGILHNGICVTVRSVLKCGDCLTLA